MTMPDIEMESVITLSEAAQLWKFDKAYLWRVLTVKRIRKRMSAGTMLVSYRDMVRAFGEVGARANIRRLK